jgi:hypothetical protein
MSLHIRTATGHMTQRNTKAERLKALKSHPFQGDFRLKS